jgi:hypothetical protein
MTNPCVAAPQNFFENVHGFGHVLWFMEKVVHGKSCSSA